MTNQLAHFSERLALFKEKFDLHRGSLSEVSKNLAWPLPVVKLFAHRFHILTKEEISVLDNIKSPIDEEVLGAICMTPDEIRSDLISSFQSIQEATNPFNEIDALVKSRRAKHPLESISSDYWNLIFKYLKDRQIDKWPFNKKAIRFIGSISPKGGFSSQSEKQKSWILGLLKADKEGFDVIPIFTNEIVREHGLIDDLKIIKEVLKCL